MADRWFVVCDILSRAFFALLSSDMTIEEVLVDFPDIEHDDLLAALELGALFRSVGRCHAVRCEGKVPVDAQLPARLARFMSSLGPDTLHTLELPDSNRTADAQIVEVTDGSIGSWSLRIETSETATC